MVRVSLLLLAIVASVSGQRIFSSLGVWADRCAHSTNLAFSNNGVVNQNKVCLSEGETVLQHTIVVPHDKSADGFKLVAAAKGTDATATPPQNVLGNSGILVEGDRLSSLDTYADAINTKQAELCIGEARTVEPGMVGGTCACDAAFLRASLSKVDTGALRDTTLNLAIPIADVGGLSRWVLPALESEDTPRPLCWKQVNAADSKVLEGRQQDSVVFSGLWFTTAFHCTSEGNTVDPKCSEFTATKLMTDLNLQSPADIERRTIFFAGRDTCCASTNSLGYQVDTCINANVQGCCDGIPYDLKSEKCCTNTNAASPSVVRKIDEPCGCMLDNMCPSGEVCCLQSKYSDYTQADAVGRLAQNIRGKCYNPSNANERCCNTGDLYDPGQQQCCSINGLQTLDVPCPCGADTDCAGGQNTGNIGHACCMQKFPAAGSSTCSAWDNYPSGTGHYATQQCLGVCYDPSYQTCCNGAACRMEFETCCNSTCCNVFTSTCAVGQREGSGLNRYNSLNFANAVGSGTMFRQCTEIENLNPLRAFWVFILPAALLFATIVSLGLVLVFANKASARTFSLLERFMVVLGFFTALLACALFFAPVYKYGVVLVLAALIVIMTAAIRVQFLNALCLAYLGLTLLYVLDPFVGNALGTFSSLRVDGNDMETITDHSSAGILHATGRLWHSFTTTDQVGLFGEQAENYKASPLRAVSQYAGECTKFYDYFRMDDQLVDIARRSNPMVSTFGFCARGWIFSLLLVEAFLVLFTLLLFVLTLLALLIRFRKEPDQIELEAVVQ